MRERASCKSPLPFFVPSPQNVSDRACRHFLTVIAFCSSLGRRTTEKQSLLPVFLPDQSAVAAAGEQNGGKDEEPYPVIVEQLAEAAGIHKFVPPYQILKGEDPLLLSYYVVSREM